jgi:hypothetical protein
MARTTLDQRIVSLRENYYRLQTRWRGRFC